MISRAFSGCTVSVWPELHLVETRFLDGTCAPARPNYTDAESIERAWKLGYRGDVWRMTIEHELAHTYTALVRGDPHSVVLHYVAHGGNQRRWPPGGRDEDGRAISLQEYVRTGRVSHPLLVQHMWTEYGDLRPLAEGFLGMLASMRV